MFSYCVNCETAKGAKVGLPKRHIFQTNELSFQTVKAALVVGGTRIETAAAKLRAKIERVNATFFSTPSFSSLEILLKK